METYPKKRAMGFALVQASAQGLGNLSHTTYPQYRLLSYFCSMPRDYLD